MNKHAIIKCNCVNEFQDKRYGKNMRMANPVNKMQKSKPPIFAVRCTSCSNVKTVGEEDHYD